MVPMTGGTGRARFGQRDVAEDGGEDVVEIVRDAPGHQRDAFQLGRLLEFLLQLLLAGDVAENRHDAADVAVCGRRIGRGGERQRAFPAVARSAASRSWSARRCARCAALPRPRPARPAPPDAQAAALPSSGRPAASACVQPVSVSATPLSREMRPRVSVVMTPSPMDRRVTASCSFSSASRCSARWRSLTSRRVTMIASVRPQGTRLAWRSIGTPSRRAAGTSRNGTPTPPCAPGRGSRRPSPAGPRARRSRRLDPPASVRRSPWTGDGVVDVQNVTVALRRARASRRGTRGTPPGTSPAVPAVPSSCGHAPVVRTLRAVPVRWRAPSA